MQDQKKKDMVVSDPQQNNYDSSLYSYSLSDIIYNDNNYQIYLEGLEETFSKLSN